MCITGAIKIFGAHEADDFVAALIRITMRRRRPAEARCSSGAGGPAFCKEWFVVNCSSSSL